MSRDWDWDWELDVGLIRCEGCGIVKPPEDFWVIRVAGLYDRRVQPCIDCACQARIGLLIRGRLDGDDLRCPGCGAPERACPDTVEPRSSASGGGRRNGR